MCCRHRDWLCATGTEQAQDANTEQMGDRPELPPDASRADGDEEAVMADMHERSKASIVAEMDGMASGMAWTQCRT